MHLKCESGLPIPRRLKIAFVVHDYNRHGGQSRYVAELASRYKRDHEVHVYCNRYEEPDPSGIFFHYIPAIRHNALSTILSFILPATAMVSPSYDIVHSQGLCGFYHNLATAHFCQKSWFSALTRQSIRLTWRQQLFRLLVTGLERWALCKPQTKCVIAVSDRVRNDLKHNYHRTNRVRVIYHGIDADKFNPKNRELWRRQIRDTASLRETDFAALYVGDVKKGANAAILAIAQVPDAHLLIVSGSKTDIQRNLVSKYQLSDRVHFLPHTTQIERFFAAADVFVFPTVYDPYGMVISEAMASGLPVITSRAAGAAELIDNGVDGILTPSCWDVDSIASALLQLRDDPSLRYRIGQAARSKILPYTWDRVADQTMAVYQEVVALRRQRKWLF